MWQLQATAYKRDGNAVVSSSEDGRIVWMVVVVGGGVVLLRIECVLCGNSGKMTRTLFDDALWR